MSPEHRQPLDILLPRLPPAVCGVGDFTMNLVETWPTPERFRFWIFRETEASLQTLTGRELFPFSADAEALLKMFREKKVTRLLVQYSGFGFDAKGWPRELIRGLIAWRKSNPDFHLTIMFHELWAILPWWKPARFYQEGHRRDLLRLARVSDAVLTSTEDHVRRLKEEIPGMNPVFVPIPSNIPVTGSVVERSPGTLALFGLALGRVRALESNAEPLKLLFRSGRLKKLFLIGSAGDEELKRREAEILRELPPGAAVHMGRLEAAELSQLLLSSEFGLSDQEYLSHSKSTTFMAYAAHGLKVLSRHGSEKERQPYGWLTPPGELLENRPGMEEMMAERARSLQNWYYATADWDIVAKTFSRMAR